MLTVQECFQTVPEYAASPLTDLPLLYDPEHVYPYTSYSDTADEPVPRRMRLLQLENDALRVLVAPELGGRVWSLFDKRTDREILFHNPVIKPTRILPVWAYISGGIEFNFPMAHSPTSMSTVGAKCGQVEDYVFVRVGEREIRSGMEWCVEVGLKAGVPILFQRAALRNPTARANGWMMWSNCAVQSTPGTEFVYPSGEVTVHGHQLVRALWPDVGLNWERDISRMVGLFWSPSLANSFGVFHHDRHFGLLHVADPVQVPGKKLWSYGMGRHQKWGALTTDGGGSYAEIQSGPLVDQSQKPVFPARSEMRFDEYWIPVHERAALQEPGIPDHSLPPLVDPYLGYAHSAYQQEWERFLAGDGAMPVSAVPPGLEVEHALRREIGRGNRAARAPLAIVLAFQEQAEEALTALPDPQTAAEHRLVGLILWKGLRKPAEAVAHLRAGPLHDAHACVELDQLYEELGLHAERRILLTKAPRHRHIVERQAQLALSLNDPAEALRLLGSQPWPLEHQRYVRSVIWREAQARLGRPNESVPDALGEDDLAAFGAYWSQ